MLDFEPLTLEHKELFDSYTKGREYFQAESSFANLYIWRHTWGVKIAEQDDVLYIGSKSEWGRPFAVAPFLKNETMSIAPALQTIEDYMRMRYGEFYMKAATTDIVDQIKRECGNAYQFRYDESSSEYVYKVADLIELGGKKYHSKRNHINAFLRNNVPQVLQYEPRYRDDCLALQSEWAQARGSGGGEESNEYISIMTALDNFDALGLRGIVVFLNGKLSGFSFGEKLNDTMALIHIEKARPEVNGLFPYINQQFLRLDWSDCKYVNREEDMGIPGLRQAKRSYHPAFMVDKYDVIRSK